MNDGDPCPDLQQTFACQDPVPSSLQNQRLTWGDNSGKYQGCYGGTCGKNSWVKSQAIGGMSGAKNGQMFTTNPNGMVMSNGQ